MFRDRRDAGRCLAAQLSTYRDRLPLVLALPRGGVPVGYEIATALGCPLDVLLVRKLSAPGRAELGIGAIVEGDEPQCVLNDELIRALDVSAEYIAAEVARQRVELRRRAELYRRGRESHRVSARTAIVVDDGIATGGTMRAALIGVRRADPAQLVLAVPVAPIESLDALRPEVDAAVCLLPADDFHSVGLFYEDFAQTADEEVIELLARAAGEMKPDA